jgi:CheY-like chemotaxis protein
MAGVPPLVLVVDDDQAIRESTSWLLADAGYIVRQAADGRDALCALRESEAPLVVLLDYRMPGMDGQGVLLVVAAEPELAERNAFVLITAERASMPRAIERLLDELAIPIIEKPFDMDELLDVVAQAAHRLHWTPPETGAPPSWVGA